MLTVTERQCYLGYFLKFCLRQQLFANKEFCTKARLQLSSFDKTNQTSFFKNCTLASQNRLEFKFLRQLSKK